MLRNALLCGLAILSAGSVAALQSHQLAVEEIRAYDYTGWLGRFGKPGLIISQN